MCNQKMNYLLLLILLVKPLQVMAGDVNGTPKNLYIAGFVFDENERGVTGAEIIVEYKNRKLFALRSTEAGWFESTKPIPGEYVNKEIRLTVLKRGYRFKNKYFNLKELDNFIIFHLESLDVEVYSTRDTLATGVVYGYVYHPSQEQPLPGAKATLRVGAIDLDVSFSRDSGYFTLNFPIKYFDHEATLIIEHPNYEIYRDTIQLSEQTAFKRIFHLQAKPLDIDWLVRETVIVATDEYAGGFNPFKYELNYLKLFDMFFKDRLYDPAAEFVWIFSGGAYVTRRSDITYAQVGGSWKPFGRYQKPRFSLDFAAGWAWLEDDIDDSKSNSPHFQIGISKYFQYSEFNLMAKPHIRTEITGFKENHEWRFLWSVGVGL